MHELHAVDRTDEYTNTNNIKVDLYSSYEQLSIDE
jgi:hypothetical protein